jgi:hypothetical protein
VASEATLISKRSKRAHLEEVVVAQADDDVKVNCTRGVRKRDDEVIDRYPV